MAQVEDGSFIGIDGLSIRSIQHRMNLGASNYSLATANPLVDPAQIGPAAAAER
jgi:hypothetical protein